MQTQLITLTLHSKDKPKLLPKAKPKPICKTAIYYILLYFTKLVLSFGAMMVVSTDLIPMAYAERGYHAFGAEWFLIIGAGLFVWYGIGHLIKEGKK